MAFSLADLRRAADELWPEATAADWDRVGLVSGRNEAPLARVLLAVDAVAETVEEATEWDADVLLTHHPLLLRGVTTLAEDTAKGALLGDLIRSGIALYSAHTNADAPAGGVSDRIARALGLIEPSPIEVGTGPDHGIGRVGDIEETSLAVFAERVAAVLPATVTGVRVAGDPERVIRRVALCGGAGDSLLGHPLVTSADVYVTADLRHHPAQESLELSLAAGGPALIDVSHWASEWLWLDRAAEQLAERLPGVEFRVSTRRTDVWDFAVGQHPHLP